MVNDNLRLKQSLEETRNLLEMSRITFQRQLEQMECEELAQQKRLGQEMFQLEEQLTATRKENKLLRIEYEQNVAANEQTGPINKEMRSLITTLQTNNKLLKSENLRCKKRVEEVQVEMERAKKHIAQLLAQIAQLQQQIATTTAAPKKDSSPPSPSPPSSTNSNNTNNTSQTTSTTTSSHTISSEAKPSETTTIPTSPASQKMTSTVQENNNTTNNNETNTITNATSKKVPHFC
jgi:E3 ubiquitin-protein ligase BRE1